MINAHNYDFIAVKLNNVFNNKDVIIICCKVLKI